MIGAASPAEGNRLTLGMKHEIGKRAPPGGSPEIGSRGPLPTISTRPAKFDRYTREAKLRRAAQRILYSRDLPAFEQHRTVWCQRKVTTKSERLTVYRSPTGTAARLSGIATCGNGWTCPACARRIQEGRRRELQAAMLHWIRERGRVYLLTLTFPHTADQAIGDLLGAFKKAAQHLENSRRFKAVRARFERIGAVHATEITWGANGYHPHRHDLWFAGPGLEHDRAAVRTLKSAWLRACLKHGLLVPDGTLRTIRAFWKHGLDVRGGDKAAEYVAKYGHDEQWGLSAEITRGQAKVGIRQAAWSQDQHFSMHQVLEFASNGDKVAQGVWRDYSQAVEGRRMLSWSPGLKVRLGVADLTDEELAGAPLPDEQMVGVVPVDMFRRLVAYQAVGEFLDYVADCCSDPETGQQDIDEWLVLITRRGPPTARSDVVVGTGYRMRQWDGEAP